MTTAELKYVAGEGTDIYHVIDENGEVKCGARLDLSGRSETIPHLDAALFQETYDVCPECEPQIERDEADEPECPEAAGAEPTDVKVPSGYRPVVDLLNVSKLKLNAEAGKVRIQFEVAEAQSLHLGALLRMAIGGTADVTIRGRQREFQMDDGKGVQNS